jgi:hypothetical protein
MPPPDARYYLLLSDKTWYEGKGLRTINQLRALRIRNDELQSLENLVLVCKQDNASAIAVTGIGGIGCVSTVAQPCVEANEALGKLSSYWRLLISA